MNVLLFTGGSWNCMCAKVPVWGEVSISPTALEMTECSATSKEKGFHESIIHSTCGQLPGSKSREARHQT